MERIREFTRSVPLQRSVLGLVLLSGLMSGGVARAQSTAPERPAASDGLVNIQTASAEELQTLPGIGAAKAQAIIAFRERRSFRRVEDLMRVRGIGRNTFRRLRPMITVSGPTTRTATARRRASRDRR